MEIAERQNLLKKARRADWIPKHLRDICTLSKEKINPTLAREDFRCIELEHIEPGSGRLLGYSSSKLVKSHKNVFGRGDVLFGKLRPYLKKFLFADFKGICSTEIWVLKASEEVTGHFLYYLVQSKPVLDAANVSEGTKMPRADWSKVGSTGVLVPPKAEQTAIATALSDADALITALEKLIEKKRMIKQGVMQELFSQKRRLNRFTEPWTTRTLGQLGEFAKGKGIKKDDVVNEGLACIRYGELYTRHHYIIKKIDSFIKQETAQHSYRISHGDILFAGSGETKEEIGKCAVFLGTEEAYAGGDIVVFKPKGVDPLFLGYLLNSHTVRKQKAQYAQGDAVVHIYPNGLANITIEIPSDPAEQMAVAEMLYDMDCQIDDLENVVAKYRQIKQGMMQLLLTGKVRLL